MIGRSEHQPDKGQRRRDLPEQLHRFAEQGKVDEGKTGDVAARVRQAGDQALLNRVVDHRKDDWENASPVPQRSFQECH